MPIDNNLKKLKKTTNELDSAERIRSKSEDIRLIAEDARKKAEEARAIAEEARFAAEKLRQDIFKRLKAAFEETGK